MRYIVSMLSAVVVLASAGSVTAAPQCPPGYKLECKPQTEAQKQKAPPPCRCAPLPAGSATGGGKSDIKKKNVPQVQPNKQPKG